MKIRRVILRLDSAPRSRALLEAAAELADKLQAELAGLFVENVNLLHLAGFPFAHEVGFPSATRRPLDVAAMERSLRAVAKRAEQSLALAAGRTQVRWSFRVARGAETPELMAMAMDADLVVANVTQLDERDRSERVRIVQAGNADELRAALEEAEGGILVLAGGDDALVLETLKRLCEGTGP